MSAAKPRTLADMLVEFGMLWERCRTELPTPAAELIAIRTQIEQHVADERRQAKRDDRERCAREFEACLPMTGQEAADHLRGLHYDDGDPHGTA